MKNICKYMLVSLALVSCTKSEEEIIGGEEGGKRIRIEVTGTILNNEDPTKTAMGALTDDTYYPVLWNPGDQIALVSGSSKSVVTLSLEDGASTNMGTFGGTAEDLVAPFPGTALYPAAYPAGDAFAYVGSDPDKILVGSYLPYKQTYKAGTFDDNVYPLAAVSAKQGTKYDFFNLGGVIQIKLHANGDDAAKNKLRALYLTGNDHEPIAGGVGMYFSVSEGTPLASTDAKDGPEGTQFQIGTYGSEAYEKVIIDFGADGLQLTDATTYINIAVIPQTFEHGFTIEMVDAGNLGSTFKSIENSITIQRSCVKSMKEFAYAQGEPLQIANSYVYSDPGYYVMPAYCMGNRLDVKIDPDHRHDRANLAADLLWTDMVDDSGNPLPAVTNIEYVQFGDDNNMLQFRINTVDGTPDGEPYRGNASVALYDKTTNEILWTWHLWLCEPVREVVTGGSCIAGEYNCYYPDGTEYHYAGEAASGNMIIMDRNLGAISANPDDGWKTYGLYYQNGRRDPFIGGHSNGSASAGTQTSYNNGQKDKYSVREDESTPFSTATAPTWYNATLAPNGWEYHIGYITVSESIANPMCYATAYEMTTATQGETTGNGQWTWYLYTDNQEWMDPNLGYTGTTHGTTGLSDGGHQAYWNRTKTVMDPCPVGYSVLGDKAQGGGAHAPYYEGYTKAGGDGNVTLYGNDSYSIAKNSTTGVYGMTTTHTYGSTTYKTWWPAAGVRTITGKMGSVGYLGLYFHYDHIAATHGGHGSSFYTGAVSTDAQTNHAGSVRCVREKQFGDLEKYPIKDEAYYASHSE